MKGALPKAVHCNKQCQWL